MTVRAGHRDTRTVRAVSDIVSCDRRGNGAFERTILALPKQYFPVSSGRGQLRVVVADRDRVHGTVRAAKILGRTVGERPELDLPGFRAGNKL